MSRRNIGPEESRGYLGTEERRRKKTRLAGRREIEHELWLCEDCTIAEVNGDYSGMTDERAEEVGQGIEQLVERVGPLSANWDSETGEGEEEFTHQRCDACGTTLGGGRNRFASFGKRAHETSETRRRKKTRLATHPKAAEVHDRPETAWEKWKRAVINDLERSVPRLEATRIFDRYRHEMAVRFRNGENPNDVASNFLSVWQNEPPHMRAGRAVQTPRRSAHHSPKR